MIFDKFLYLYALIFVTTFLVNNSFSLDCFGYQTKKNGEYERYNITCREGYFCSTEHEMKKNVIEIDGYCGLRCDNPSNDCHFSSPKDGFECCCTKDYCNDFIGLKKPDE